MGDVLPINTPSRSDLWRRNQLALSVLAHRAPRAETNALVRRILKGEQIIDLARPAGGAV